MMEYLCFAMLSLGRSHPCALEPHGQSVKYITYVGWHIKYYVILLYHQNYWIMLRWNILNISNYILLYISLSTKIITGFDFWGPKYAVSNQLCNFFYILYIEFSWTQSLTVFYSQLSKNKFRTSKYCFTIDSPSKIPVKKL